MEVEIEFEAVFEYAEKVSFSTHLYRLFPRASHYVRVRRAAFATNAGARVAYARDVFDNEVASCFYPDLSATLRASLRLELEVEVLDPFGFLLAPHATEFPFRYTDREKQVLAAYLETAEEGSFSLPFWQAPEAPQATVPALVALNQSFREHLAYERREEGVARSPAETLALRSGACRDFAVLLAATLRQLGMAARLVSGYFIEQEEEEGTGEGKAPRPRVAEGAMHAWTEAYLPGAGWIGLDPTNGTLCNHWHIPTAVGLTADDIAPSLGRYFHRAAVASEMTATLRQKVGKKG